MFSRYSCRPEAGCGSLVLSTIFSRAAKLVLPFSIFLPRSLSQPLYRFLIGPSRALSLSIFDGCLEAAGEGVHAADVGVEQIDRFDRLAAHLGIEVQAAGRETAVLEQRVHRERAVIKIGGELVGVPAEHQVAAVGIDRSENAVACRVFQFVPEGMTGKRAVVGFEIQFEVFHQTVLLKEGVAGARIRVVLVGGGFLGLGFDVELAREFDRLLVIDRQVQELGEVIEFAVQVRIEQRVITFATAPEGVAAATEVLGDFHGLLHLRRGVGEDLRIGIGRCARHVARVREQIGGAPQQFDAGVGLQLLGEFGDAVQIRVALTEVATFGSDIAIVEAPVIDTELGVEFKGRAHGVFG